MCPGENDVSEWFPCWIGTGLCDVSFLFNVYMDRVVREVKIRVLEKGWIAMCEWRQV